MKRKVFVLLAAILTLSVLAALPAFALDVPTADDGTNSELEAIGYKGITTEEEFKAQSSGKLYLKNDITLTSGLGTNKVDAVVDGNGHTIYLEGGLTVINWGKNITVKNLTIAGDVVVKQGSFNWNGMAHYGPLSIHGFDGDVLLSNVHSRVNITVEDSTVTGSIGGIMGKTHATAVTLENVSYVGKMDTGSGNMTCEYPDMRNIGGIMGMAGGTLYATNVFVDAQIEVANKNFVGVGGLFGLLRGGESFFRNCSFNGSLTVEGEAPEESGVGGIVGYLKSNNNFEDSAQFFGVTNNANITVGNEKTLSALGGILGYANTNYATVAFKKAINSGTVQGAKVAGGILGKAYASGENDPTPLKDVSFDTVKNAGAVSAVLTAGGIVGDATTNSPFILSNVINTAYVKATDADNGRAAGILADYASNLNTSIAASNIFNTGDISAVSAAPLFNIGAGHFPEAQEGPWCYSNSVEGEHYGDKMTDEEIETLIGKIDFVVLDTYVLSVAVRSLDGKIETDYTPESWKIASTAVKAGQALLTLESATQELIDAAVKAINEAVAVLECKPIDKTVLDRYLAEAASLNKDDYRGDTWRNLTRALSSASAEFTKQSEVDSAASQLRAAINSLVRNDNTSDIDFEEFSILLAACRMLKAEDYSESSWAEFSEVLSTAENAKSYAEQQAMYKPLLSAMNKLINVKALNEVLGMIPENREDYINAEGLWEALDSMEKKAAEALNNRDVTQEYIDEIVRKIQNLLDELKLTESDIVDIVGSDKYSDMQNAWDDFVAQNGTGSPFIDKTGDTFDCQSTVTAPVAVITALLALGAGVTFKKKKD